MLKKIRDWAKKLKLQLVIIYLVSQDDRTPWYAKWAIYLTLAYALSPVDLIPDFIPVIGFLDDLVLIPIGIYLAVLLTPKIIFQDASKKADTYNWSRKKSWLGLTLIIIIWLTILIIFTTKITIYTK